MTIRSSPEDLQARAEEVAGLLKLLSHPNRLRIACELREREASVSALKPQSVRRSRPFPAISPACGRKVFSSRAVSRSPFSTGWPMIDSPA